jgi:hypothetical protein
MKKTLLLVLIFTLSFSAFAGDLILMCEDLNSERAYDASFSEGSFGIAKVEFAGKNLYGELQNFSIIAKISQTQSAIVYNINNEKDSLRVSTQSIQTPVMVTPTMFCSIRD